MNRLCAVLAAILLFASANLAAAQVAPNGSCNGRINENTFFTPGIAQQGGSHLAGETTTFSVQLLRMMELPPQDIPTALEQSARTFKANGATSMIETSPINPLFSLSISVSGPGVNLTLCDAEACNGASFTAPADGDFRFSVSVLSPEIPVSVTGVCTALETPPNDDIVEGEPPEEVGAEAPTGGGSEPDRTGVIAGNVDGIHNNLEAARMPTWGEASDSIVEVGRNSSAMNGVDFSISSAGLQSQLDDSAASPFSVWTRARFTQLDDDDSQIEGPIFEGRVGAEYSFSDDLKAGAFGSFLTADIESTLLSTSVDETRYGGGAYLRVRLDDNVQGMLSGFYEAGNADITSFGGTGSADVDRLRLTVLVNARYGVGDFVWEPRVEAGYYRQTRDEYTDSLGRVIPERELNDLHAAFGSRFAYPVAMDEGFVTLLTPFVDFGFQYLGGSDQDLITANGSFILEDREYSASIEGGFEAGFVGGGSLIAQIGVVGLGRQATGFTGRLFVDVPF
ncbi:MAG: autotransporter outer membrane beta-barrel domain-containing protein [Pseudomonadota bacterium]